MTAYHFRTVNNLEQNQFLTFENLKDFDRRRFGGIVFLDDFVGSGNQAIRQYHRVISALKATLNANYLVYGTLVCCEEGLHNIMDCTSLSVVTALTISLRERAFFPGHVFSYDVCAEQRRIFQAYGQTLFPDGPLGYNGTGALISFFYNTPNNALPILWSTKDRWQSIVKRREPTRPEVVSRAEAIVNEIKGSNKKNLGRLLEANLKHLNEYEFLYERHIQDYRDIFEILSSRNEICKFQTDSGDAYAVPNVGVCRGILDGHTSLVDLAKSVSLSLAVVSKSLTEKEVE